LSLGGKGGKVDVVVKNLKTEGWGGRVHQITLKIFDEPQRGEMQR